MQTSIVCSICGKGKTVITDPESGEIICSNCGMVISDKIQEISKPEWRAFDIQEANAKSRTGAPTSLAYHDRGLATVIGTTNRDARGQKMDAAMSSTMKRLKLWDLRTQVYSPKDKNLKQAFSELDVLKDKLGLPDAAIEKAAYIYRKAQERKLVRGRTTSGILTAIVYAVCREMGMHRTLKDIAAISNIKRKVLSKSYRMLVFELGLKIPIVDPMKCIAKVANNANISEKTKRQAMNIMNDITKKEIGAGKNPMAVAATVLYLSCLDTKEDSNISQSYLAMASGVTEVTIRNRLRELEREKVSSFTTK
jgi:transcription initiation factor TFIIB